MAYLCSNDRSRFLNRAGPPADLVSAFADFYAAILTTKAGGGDTRILAIGDSTTAGVGGSTNGTVPAFKAYPARLAHYLAQKIPSAIGMGNPRRFSGDKDDRWTYGTGWGFGGSAWSSVDGTDPAGALVYTPGNGETFDRFDVHYLTAGVGLGTITIQATGGSASVVDTNFGPQTISKTTVACASAGTGNSVSITGVGGCYIVGVEPWLSTQSRVRCGNVGVPGADSAAWASNTSFNRLKALETHDPHLTIVSLGINDAGASVSAATFETNLTTIVQSAKTSGTVLLMTPPPPSGAPYEAGVASYLAKYAAVAAAESVPLLDIYTIFGGAWNGSLMDDTLHPNDAGYDLIGLSIYNKIKPLF